MWSSKLVMTWIVLKLRASKYPVTKYRSVILHLPCLNDLGFQDLAFYLKEIKYWNAIGENELCLA